MNEIWIEKYRPKALKDIVGQRDIIDRLESYVQVRNLPHLMFAGPAGTGKTTSAIALAKSLYGDNWKANFNELNASDERGIDVVRGKIKDFARTAPIGGAEFKIIFLDEADALTADAQSALRRTMERYSKTCRFILSCVTPDTTILLSEDREIEIGDFMRKFENREIKNTLGLNEGGKALENDLVLFGMQMSPSANGKRVYELTTMSGRVLKVTEDHPILTNEGWTTVSEIVPGTKVVVYPHLEGTPLEEDPRQVIDVDDLKKFLSDKESDGREGDGEHGGSTTARWDDVGNGMRYLRPLVPQGKGSTVREIKEVNDLNDKDRQVWRKDIGDPIDLKKTSTCRIAQSIERKRFVDRAVDGKIRSFRAIEQQHRNERDFRGIRGSIEPESSMEMASAPVERHAVGTTIPKGTTDEVITELAEMGLLPLAYSDEHIGALTRIVAFLLAGGNVPTERDGLLFVGREDVLSAVRKDLETLHVECSELEGMEKEDDLSEGHLAGKTTWFCADSQPFALLCEYLGAPCGYKTKSRLSVPSWVSNGTRFVKREFLRALFGCCGDEPSLDGKNNFHAISFRQCSVPELRGETLAFLEQLKNLLSQFNIVGFIEESRTGYEGGRNGRMPIIFSLVLDTSHDNLLAFFKQVGYAYDKGKIRKAQLAGEYLKYRSFAVDRQKTKAEQVLLEIVGHSQREISGEYAGGPGPVASNNPGEPSHLPHDLMDYSEWVMRYDIPGTELVLNEIICKREMECDDVRDIGCLKNHNFIANGIVSHNCNYSSKIIEPIQSRCAVFRFRPLRAEDVHKYLHQIVTSENLTITEDALEALVHVSQGDMRKAINSLQVAASLGENITVEVVYHTTGTARPEEVRDLLQTAISGDFIAARNRLDDIMISYGLSGEDIIRQIHRTVFDLDIPDYEKVKLMDRTGEIEFRMVEGANERIQLESLLAYMVLVGEHRGDSAD